MKSGYIKLWRKLEDSPIFMNSEAVHLFIYLLIKASRSERKTAYKTTVINLLPGQLVTGRKKLSEATGINESKVYRILELLKSEQQIEQQTNSKYSIITICNWSMYQESEQQTNNKRTTNEQQMNTIQEVKELKNGKKESKAGRFTPPTIEEARNHFLHLNAADESEAFYHHFQSTGWKLKGGQKMASWQSAIVNWIKRDFSGIQERHKIVEAPPAPVGSVYIPKNEAERRTLETLRRYEEQAARYE